MKLFAKPAVITAIVVITGCEITSNQNETIEPEDYSTLEIATTIEAQMPAYPTIQIPEYGGASDLEEKISQLQIESMRNDPENTPEPTDDQPRVRKLLGDPIKINHLPGERQEWHYCTQIPEGDVGFSARLAVFEKGKLISLGEDTGAAYAVCELTSQTTPTDE